MIIHLAHDGRFIDHVINVFEKASPHKNIYLIEVEDIKLPLNSIKSKNPNIRKFNKLNSEFIKEIVLQNQPTSIIIHNLLTYRKFKFDIIKNAPKTIHFHWMCWGGDLYPHINKYRKSLYIYLPEKKEDTTIHIKYLTSQLLSKLAPNIFYKFYLQRKGLDHPKAYQNIIKKIKTISTVLPDEQQIVKKYLNKNIRYLPFKYISLESALLYDNSPICKESNYLIGNSAHPTSNHMDAFNLIANTNVSNIFVPLSYGNEGHKRNVIYEGNQLFGERFKPILEFIPLDEYNKILLKCGNVIMNQTRQQAVGNIVASLWFGARVFLRKENLVYNYFKRNGIILYLMDDLRKERKLLSYNTLAKHNRPLLKKMYSEIVVISETKNLIKYLNQAT